MSTNLSREERNAPLVRMIINALEGIKLDIDNNSEGRNRVKYKYLIGQAIRQYIIHPDNWHLSIRARDKWKELTDSKIENFSYRESFECNQVQRVYIEKHFYKGASKTPSVRKIRRNEKIVFNSIFIAEHTTPVLDIRTRLEELPNPTIEDVKDILDSIHITRMLKSEDRLIKQKDKRPLLFEDIETDVYNSVGIVLVKEDNLSGAL